MKLRNNTFTIEEENLICVFSATDRQAAIDGLYASLPYQIDIDLITMTHKVAQKLKRMTDIEFMALDLSAEEE